MNSDLLRLEELLSRLQSRGLFRVVGRTKEGVTLEMDGVTVALSNRRALVFLDAAANVPDWYLATGVPYCGWTN